MLINHVIQSSHCRYFSKAKHQDRQGIAANNGHVTVTSGTTSGIEIPVVLAGGNPIDENSGHQNVAVIRAQTGDSATASDPITIHITLGGNVRPSPSGPFNTRHISQLPPGAAVGANMNVVIKTQSDDLEESSPRAMKDQGQMENVQGNNVEYAYANSCINTSTTAPSHQPDIVPAAVYEDMSLTGNSTMWHQYLMQPSGTTDRSLDREEPGTDHEYVNSRRHPPVPEPPSIIRLRSSPSESSDEVSGDREGNYVNTTKLF